MTNHIDKIHDPRDLQELTVTQLNELSQEIRDLITHSVSQTGGHLASNLGVVELTVAMHKVFNFHRDRLLWDVGHQCYAHKILTGRKDQFSQLRQEGGLSGFPSPAESDTDVFSVGHAGTSIATALGMALGAQHKQTDEKIVALVGDASIVNGLSFEALNNLGLVKRQMLIILNDNSMAIDVTQGAMAKFLSRVRLSHTYEDLRTTTNKILDHLPLIGRPMEEALENFKKTLRMTISPSRLFESLNIPYFGPVDGHDIGALVQLFEAMNHLEQPAILHVYTKKGKGFTPADDNPRKYHSTGPFEINGNLVNSAQKSRSFTEAFGDVLVEQAKKDPDLVAITAAMPDGTGMIKFREQFKDRYYDVGIAESIGVDIAAGMAHQGLKPVVCIYSTFLQRGFDQIFQEVSLQNLPVVFCIDRAGVVGDDGPTHHGLWDLAYLRPLPNLVLISPADEQELIGAMEFACQYKGPVAIRYPRDRIVNQVTVESGESFTLGRGVLLREGSSEFVLAALGVTVPQALEAAELLEREGISVSVFNARFAKPIDPALVQYYHQGKTIITLEDHSVAGGFGEALVGQAAGKEQLSTGNQAGKAVLLGAGDQFVPAAKRIRQHEWMDLTAEKIAQVVKKIISNDQNADIPDIQVLRKADTR